MPISLEIKNLAPIAQIELSDPEILQVGDRLSYTFPSDTFVDPEADGLQYRALTISGNGSLPDFLSFNPITRTLSGTSTAESAGRYSVFFQADDSYGGIVNSSVILVHVNTQPRVNLSKWELTTGGINKPLTATIPPMAMIDVDGDIVTYELVNNDPRYLVPSWLSFNGTTLSGTPIANNHQPLQLLIRGKDPFGGVGEMPVSLMIQNTLPRLQIVLSKPDTVHLGSGISVDYSIQSDAAVDVDGDVISWNAKLADGSELPSGLSFSSASRLLSGLPAAGVYNVTFIASDGHGGSVNQTIMLRVNSQPVANMADVLVILPGIHKPFSWTLPATAMIDSDGDTITYGLVRTNPEYIIPSWLSFNGTALTGTPTANSHQPIQLLIRGKDSFGGFGEMPVSLIINVTSIFI